MKFTTNNHNLLAAVRKGNLSFFIDQDGKKLNTDAFQFTDNFSCGWACVNLGGDRIQDPEGVIGGNFRYVNVAGEYLSFRFSSPSYFSNNLSIIESGVTRFIIDNNGEMVGEGYNNAYPFRNGLSAAAKGATLGYLNTECQWEILMKPGDTLHSFSDGIAQIQRDGKIGFINPSGQWLIEPQDLTIFDFREALAAYEEKGNYGVMNDSGETVVEAIYEDIGNYSEGLCAVKQRGLWGFIDKSGNIIHPPRYDQVRHFSEGLAAVKVKEKIGYVNVEGEMIIPPSFESGFEFKNGLCIVQENGVLGYIDRQGQWAVDAQFNRANLFVSPEDDNPYYKPN